MQAALQSRHDERPCARMHLCNPAGHVGAGMRVQERGRSAAGRGRHGAGRGRHGAATGQERGRDEAGAGRSGQERAASEIEKASPSSLVAPASALL